MRLEIVLFMVQVVLIFYAGHNECFVESLNSRQYFGCLKDSKLLFVIFFIKLVLIGYLLQRNVHKGQKLSQNVVLPVLSFIILAVTFLYVGHKTQGIEREVDEIVDRFRMGSSYSNWMGISNYQKKIKYIQNINNRSEYINKILNTLQREQISRIISSNDGKLPAEPIAGDQIKEVVSFSSSLNQSIKIKISFQFDQSLSKRNKQMNAFFSYLKSQRFIISFSKILLNFAFFSLLCIGLCTSLLIVIKRNKSSKISQIVASIYLSIMLIAFVCLYYLLAVTNQFQAFDKSNKISKLKSPHALLQKLFLDKNKIGCLGQKIDQQLSFTINISPNERAMKLSIDDRSPVPPFSQSNIERIRQIIRDSFKTIYNSEIRCEEWRHLSFRTNNLQVQMVNVLLISNLLLCFCSTLNLIYMKSTAKPDDQYVQVNQTEASTV